MKLPCSTPVCCVPANRKELYLHVTSMVSSKEHCFVRHQWFIVISRCKARLACLESGVNCSSYEVPRSQICSSFQPHSSNNACCTFCLVHPLHRLVSRMKSKMASCSRRSVNQLSQMMIARVAVNLATMKLLQTAMPTRLRTYDSAVFCISTVADFIRGPIRGRLGSWVVSKSFDR